MTMAQASSGCTAAVVQAGAEEPTVLALLPLAFLGDLLQLGIRGSSGGATSTVARTVGNWRDPGDWVGACTGPLTCPLHQVFECTGVPGDCSCQCVVISPSAALAAAARP